MLSSVLEICKPVTVFGKTRYSIDFSSFETTSASRCQCSFFAPVGSNLQLSPVSDSGVSVGCGTKIEITVNGNTYSGGSTECKADPLFDATARTGDTVEVKIFKTSTAIRRAQYCYIAEFLVNGNIQYCCLLQAYHNNTHENISFLQIHR